MNKNVSILTSLYNHDAKYVRQCLDSLCRQTLKNVEFILIDNGANNDNKILIKEYLQKDPRFKAVYLEENIGMGAALNRGIEISTGEYIGFLESDDYAEPDMYFDLYNAANSTDADVIKSFFRILDDKGAVQTLKNFPASQCEKILGRGICTGLIQGHVSHWSGIYRKEFLQKNHIRFNETPGGHSQDFGFVLKCYAFANSVYVIPKAYVTYRLFTGRHDAKFLNDCILDEIELTFKMLRQTPLPQEIWEVLFLRIAPRLKMCLQTADKQQKKRITKELKLDEKYQSYKYFSKDEKMDIIKITSKYKFILLKICDSFFIKKVINDKKRTRAYLCNALVICKNEKFRKVYLFGIPVFYKKYNVKIEELQKQLEQLKNFVYYAPYIANCVADLHKKVLPPYKNIYRNEKIVICGSGPSLNYYSPLKKSIHIGLNRAFEKENLKCDYIFAWDFYNLLKDDSLFLQKIKQNPAKKILGRFINDKILQVNEDFANQLDALMLYSSARHNFPVDAFDDMIHYDIEHYPLMDFGSCAFGAFHFALYTGSKCIYLVGIDNSLSGYFKKEFKQRFLMVDIILAGWNKVKTFCKIYYPDVEIISVNPVGLKGIFHDVYTQSYLDEHPELKNEDIEILNAKECF